MFMSQNTQPLIGANGRTFEENWISYAGMSPYYYNLIDDISNPFLGQYIEWSQQMTSQMYQNQWESEQARMQRGIDAGINPYLMANGIAGAGFSTMPSPNSAIGSGSASLGAVANGVAGLANAFNGNLTGAVSNFSNIYKLKHEVNNIDADTQKKFMEMGFTELQSKAMSVSLKYLDDKEKVGVWQALADLKKTKQEYKNLVSTHKNIIAQYDEIIANKELLIATKGEVEAKKIVDEAEASKLKALTQWQNIENNFFLQHRYKLGSPIYEGLRDAVVGDAPVDELQFGDTIVQYQGKLDMVHYNAQASASWNTRPTNAVEWSAWVGSSLGKNLRELILNSTNSFSLLDALSKVKNKEESDEFNDAYDDVKSELYSNYRMARKEYRSARRSAASDQYIYECRQRMEKAKKQYDNFTKKEFSDILLGQYNGQSR